MTSLRSMSKKTPSIVEKLKSLAWPRDKAAALELEGELLSRVRLAPLAGPPRLVAGVDAAFSGAKIIGAACLYEYPALLKVAESVAVADARFPYIPGFLSFREGPAVIDAISGLPDTPDLLLFDGQGIAHPRGLGIAAFVGAALDIPSVGTAKSRLVGEYAEPGLKKGSTAPLEHRGEVVGAVVRTRDSTRPLFVSPGHAIDVEGAVDMVLACATRYRLAEPVRCADGLSRKVSREMRAAARRG